MRGTSSNAGGHSFSGVALLTAFAGVLSLAACRKEEQAVVAVAQNAAQAEQKVQAPVTERDRQRAELGKIPLPTKSQYINIHDPGEWANPFISADAAHLDLRVTIAPANPRPTRHRS